MLLKYIAAAMRRARYQLLEGDEGFFGEIRGFEGLWANARTLEACREELQATLCDWLVVKLRHGDRDLPVVAGVDLNRGSAPRRHRDRKVA